MNWLAVLLAGAVVLAIGLVLHRAWSERRTLLAQARELQEGRWVEVNESPWHAWPGTRELTRSLNATVRRLHALSVAQAEQVAQLQRQAQQDPITGLPLRTHFLGQLQPQLAQPGAPGLGLLLVRVLDLDALNPRLGHEGTDRLLAALADVLLTYVDRVPGAFAGRLNGSDFALCLPVPGVALETARSLRGALAAVPALRLAAAQVVVGGADGLQNLGPGAALALADAALARAEAAADRGIVASDEAVTLAAADQSIAEGAGAGAWREQIASALTQGRVSLEEFPVVDAASRLLYLECPLRVQMETGGGYLAAERWLALARRSRLLPQTDLAAIELALQACNVDGRVRAVHAAAASLASPGFIDEVGRRLAATPRAAALLRIECVESIHPVDSTAPLAAAAAAWRPWGVRIGVEYAGASAQRLPELQAAGIDYLKIEARHVRGLAHDAAIRGYAQSLVALIHGLGLRAIAQGIDDAADLQALWTIAFDGATGPAIQAMPETAQR